MLPRISYFTVLDIYLLVGFLFIAVFTLFHAFLPTVYINLLDVSVLTLPPTSYPDEQDFVDVDQFFFHMISIAWVCWQSIFAVYFFYNRYKTLTAFFKSAFDEHNSSKIMEREEPTGQEEAQ